MRQRNIFSQPGVQVIGVQRPGSAVFPVREDEAGGEGRPLQEKHYCADKVSQRRAVNMVGVKDGDKLGSVVLRMIFAVF